MESTKEGAKLVIKSIEALKTEGNCEFQSKNYYKAVLLYEEGLRRAQAFAKEHQGNLSYRMEFGDHSLGGKEEEEVGKVEDETGGYGIFVQDLSRMKAMLYNNIATCFFHMGNLPKAEINNEMALVEEPDYAKALLRKVLILERKGEYS
jgi:tetratricopeptide (TPR) repeat protein